MEAFSLLKFWKSSSSAANTILAAVSDTEDDGAGDPPAAGDDGPFFDLEFAGPDSDSDDGDDEKSVAELVCLEAEESERSDPDLPVSPSDEVFFSGEVLAVGSGSDTGAGKTQLFPVALVRSATRLRVLMSGLKRSSRPAQARSDPTKQRKKLFTVKFKAGEVPIVSLFTRDHSARPLNGVVSSLSSSSSTSSSSSSASSSSAKQPPSPSPSPKPKDEDSEHQSPAPDRADEKRNPKDGVQKYFKMVKPLYIRVSKRYGEKLGLGSGSPASPVAAEDKATENQEPGKESGLKTQGSLGVGLKVMMRKRLSGKSKSAEAGVVHPAAPAAAGGRQRDDSLNQQQEWIQGAILHCKRSFNASRDDESASVLSRSASDPSHEKTGNSSSEEQNDVVGG